MAAGTLFRSFEERKNVISPDVLTLAQVLAGFVMRRELQAKGVRFRSSRRRTESAARVRTDEVETDSPRSRLSSFVQRVVPRSKTLPRLRPPGSEPFFSRIFPGRGPTNEQALRPMGMPGAGRSVPSEFGTLADKCASRGCEAACDALPSRKFSASERGTKSIARRVFQTR